jgi:membrane protein required for colicin V production
MNILDIIFLVPLLFALYRGFKNGIIHMAASLAALVLGIFLAIKLRPLFASLLNSVFHIAPDNMNIIAFSVAFVSIVLVVHLIAIFVEKLVKAVALNFVNRLLGMGFGLLVTAFVISMILWPVNKVNEQRQIIKPERIAGSFLYKPLSAFAPAVFPYLKKEDWKEFIPKKKKGKENVVPVAI